MAQRRVIRGSDRSFKARAKRFGTSFLTPNNFKRYWLNAEGAQRAAKIVGAGFLGMFVVFIYFAKDLPSPSKINARIGSQNTVFYDRTGQVKIYEVHGDKNRRVIDFNDMPPNIKNATIAIEDKDFYKHGAFSIFGIGRAFTGIVTHHARGGGSTITQQYVKNALLSDQRSVSRKIKELILSLEIEQLYKKDDILKLYLNEIPYGNQAYGIESACRTYFSQDIKNDKCAANLTLSQASMLAAIPNLPTYYNPYGEHTDALVERQHIILDDMVQQKMISKSDADQARLDPTNFKTQVALNQLPNTATQVSDYPHFAQYALEYLENKYGVSQVENGGLKVITSLDVDKQKLMQRVIQNDPNGIAAVRRSGGTNVAAVSADPKTGQILAMMGSYDVNDPQYGAFNVALANRQPGSSFKPFVYSQLMKGNWGPGSTIYDVTTDFGGGYKPKNYSGRNYGVQSVRTALDGSLNIPAVKALYIAGVKKSVGNAHSLGITTLNDPDPQNHYGLSLVLGSGEVKLNDMVNGYEGFANGGMHFDATPILKATDPHNHVVEDNSHPKGKRVLDPQVSYLMANILSDDKSRQYIFGANNPLHISGRTVAAKTGTTENYNDAWTMGFSPDLVTGIWAGNNNNKPMSTEAVDIAAPIWHDYMAGFYDSKAHEKVSGALSSYSPDSKWTAPAGIQTLTLDANTGGAVTPGTRNRRTDIFPSWYKVPNAGGVRSATIDKVSGKLATSCTPPEAQQSITAGQIHAEIPSTDPLYKNWEPPVAALARTLGYSSGGGVIPTDSDDIHHCEDAKPTVSIHASGNNPIHVTANVTSGTYPANKLTIYWDDQVISSQSINGNTNYSFDYQPTSDGSHTLKAVVSDAALYSATDETTVTVSTQSNSSPNSTTQDNSGNPRRLRNPLQNP